AASPTSRSRSTRKAASSFATGSPAAGPRTLWPRRSFRRSKDRDMIRAEKITETSWQDLVRAVRSYVGRRVANPEDRDDLVQDVMLRIHRNLNALKAQ